ncbi:MAG: Gfo/Idh/MocA family oxidoreductase [Planctomycetota bacterium]
MATEKPVGIGFVGCGNIAGPYAKSVLTHKDRLKIVGAADVDPARAEAFAKEHGGRAFGSYEEMLDCDEVEIVVNLTIHLAHAEVTRQALDAGKHVHSEKPLATKRKDAVGLVSLVKKRGLLLGCSPFVILGEAQQTLWKAVRDGMIGRPLEAMAEMMHGRIESWHPNPGPFYGEGAGPMLDVGCYPLNVLTSILGPVESVRGAAATRIPERTIASGPKAGEAFRVITPDHVNGLLQFACGAGGRLGASFTVAKTVHTGVEIHGTAGALRLESPTSFNSPVQFCPIGSKEWQPVPYVADPFKGIEWSRGLLDMADAIRTGRRPRCTGEQAAHILDICLSILDAAEKGKEVKVASTFASPEPVYT